MRQLRRIRILIALVIAGLVLSGLSALPLLRESVVLERYGPRFHLPAFFIAWMTIVHRGLAETHMRYPFIQYGTDWLAFGHFVVAIFMVGALVDPKRNVWLIHAGMIACLLVIPTALICGAYRGIPLWWRAIDSSFGIFGFIPLWIAARLTRQLRA